MNLIPWVIGWTVLTAIVIILAIYRWMVASKEDDSLHVSDSEIAVVGQQVVVAKKLASVDLWGKTLTVIAAIYALALLGAFLYKGWTDSSGPSFT